MSMAPASYATITNAEVVTCFTQQSCQAANIVDALTVDCSAVYSCVVANIRNSVQGTTDVNCSGSKSCPEANIGTADANVGKVVCSGGNACKPFSSTGWGAPVIFSSCLDCLGTACGETGCNYNGGTDNCKAAPDCVST